MRCPFCKKEIREYKNPLPTVDIIIELEDKSSKSIKVVLIERINEPFGWALPGGFIDYGESAEDAAIREAKEETDLKITKLRLLGVYSDPARDPRHHTLTVVYIARAKGSPTAGDDARNIKLFSLDHLPANLAFDHKKILQNYLEL